MRKKKVKKNKEPQYYYQLDGYKGNEPIYIPYQWKFGEKEEYEKICSIAEGWGGNPCDVNWAKSTQPYKDAKQLLQNKNPQ